VLLFLVVIILEASGPSHVRRLSLRRMEVSLVLCLLKPDMAHMVRYHTLASEFTAPPGVDKSSEIQYLREHGYDIY
jgi:hypothetical protein